MKYTSTLLLTSDSPKHFIIVPTDAPCHISPLAFFGPPKRVNRWWKKSLPGGVRPPLLSFSHHPRWREGFLKITERIEQILGIQVHPGWCFCFFCPIFFGYPPRNQKKNGTWNFWWLENEPFLLGPGRIFRWYVSFREGTCFWFELIFEPFSYESVCCPSRVACGWCFLVCRVGVILLWHDVELFGSTMFHSTIVRSLRGDDVRDCKFRHQASYIPATRSALRREFFYDVFFPRKNFRSQLWGSIGIIQLHGGYT